MDTPGNGMHSVLLAAAHTKWQSFPLPQDSVNRFLTKHWCLNLNCLCCSGEKLVKLEIGMKEEKALHQSYASW